jgi:hypothetical protein
MIRKPEMYLLPVPAHVVSLSITAAEGHQARITCVRYGGHVWNSGGGHPCHCGHEVDIEVPEQKFHLILVMRGKKRIFGSSTTCL